MHSFIVSLTQTLLGFKHPSSGEHKLKMYSVYSVYSQAQNLMPKCTLNVDFLVTL